MDNRTDWSFTQGMWILLDTSVFDRSRKMNMILQFFLIGNLTEV